MKRVTLDSNVYLSGFVFGGKPKRVLEMAVDGEIEVAVSDPIIQEVRRHLLGKFGWSEPRAAGAVESIVKFAKRANKTPTSTRLRWPSRLLRRPEALQSLERVTHPARSDACPGRIDKHCAT